jgi:hypothetical protein
MRARTVSVRRRSRGRTWAAVALAALLGSQARAAGLSPGELRPGLDKGSAGDTFESNPVIAPGAEDALLAQPIGSTAADARDTGAAPGPHPLRRHLRGERPSSGDADIATTLVCGPAVPVGPGGQAEFQRHVLDVAAFPDALCNDGTPAALFFRPYAGAANRNKWMINLHGGGSCQDGETCAARWCNCAAHGDTCPYTTKPTYFDRTTMTNVGPPQKAADGLALRGDPLRPNPYGDYNQIELDYCTSDLWIGNRRAVPMTTVNPRTDAPVTYTINFLGARVLDADIVTLRRAGVPGLVYTIAGGAVELPDLDEATEVIFTGDSAGGAGVMSHLDDLRSTLESSNVNCQGGGACPLATYGLLDASVGPEMAKLDFGTYVQPLVGSYEDYLVLLSLAAFAPGARLDASCTLFHAADPLICHDITHVLRHHVTTPFFVRMALLDELVSGNYIDAMLRNPDLTPVTVPTFARTLHDELATFVNLSATAEEGSQFTREPGVFAPGCTKHDTIHSTLDTFGTTITPPGGPSLRLLGVFENWQTGGGTPTNLLTRSVTLADTVCP